MAATVFKSAGTCTDISLPKLYRDPAASDGSLFCFDVLDPYSWPSQAAPSGAATLVDLLGKGNAAIGSVPVGWSNGFVFDSDSDLITLPATSKLATDVAAFGVSLWIKNTTSVGTTKGIAGIGGGYNYASTQWALHRDNATIVYTVDGLTGGAVALTVGAVTNWCITLELSVGAYTAKLWRNGVNVHSGATFPAPMVSPTGIAAATIGNVPFVHAGTGDDFVFYRCHADSLTSRSAAQFVAAEYAAGVGRFS